MRDTKKYSINIHDTKIGKHLKELIYIENTISKMLDDYPNFDGISLTFLTKGIQINGHHKEIIGYTFGDSPVINKDFTNVEECINHFVSVWKKADNEEYLRSYKRFLEDGERWGFD